MKRFLPGSEFGRNVLTLVTGTSIAQAIPIALSPVLTRIYTPEDFGVFALYSALMMIIGGVSAGHYELAITLPVSDEDAAQVVVVAASIAIWVCLLVAIVVTIFQSSIGAWLGSEEIGAWLYLLPFSILLTGLFLSLNYWLIRKKRFKQVAASQVGQATGVGSVQLGMGLVAPAGGGLIWGTFCGQAVAVSIMVRFAAREILSNLAGLNWKRVKALMYRYRKFPLLQGASTLIGASASQLPVVLLGTFFGTGVVGFFALSQRVIRAPLNIVGTSIGEVFRQRASEDYANTGNAQLVFRTTFKQLLILSTPTMALFALVAPELFAFVFGEAWRVAGEYARILSPLFWLSFIVTPLSVMIFIAERQEISLMLQIYLILASAGAMTLGGVYFESAEASLAAFALAFSSKYCLELFLAFRLSLGRA